MATAYTSDKKIGALDPVIGALSATDELVVNKNGDTLKTTVSQVETAIFAAKTSAGTPQSGDVVVVRRGSLIRQLETQNLVPDGAITKEKIAAAAGIEDSKLATIASAGKVLNSATTATSANTADAIVTRDSSGNFSAGMVTANVTGDVTGNVTGDLTGTASAIADGSVSTAKIVDDSVTAQKLDGIADIAAKTANYTLVLADAGRVIEFSSASNLTLTVPTNATAAFATGATVTVTRRGAGDVTVAGASGVTLRSGGNRLKIGQQYAGIALIKIGTNEWMVLGDLKA
jgi:hypothetical protein